MPYAVPIIRMPQKCTYESYDKFFEKDSLGFENWLYLI